jgi:hypothetical protein
MVTAYTQGSAAGSTGVLRAGTVRQTSHPDYLGEKTG